MSTHRLPPSRQANRLPLLRSCSAVVLLLAAAWARAQAPATSDTPTRADEARGTTTTTVIHDSRRIERITVEDAGSRVDELREGGETRKITVQPKAQVPAYDVRPPDSGAGSRSRDGGSGNAGERSWKLLNF